PPKPGNEHMSAVFFRRLIGFGLGLWITAIIVAPASATAVHLRNAHTELLSFTALAGWRDDDQKEAFEAFLKSCGAILNGTRAMRTARPFYGALFKVCERAMSAGQAQGFFTGYYETEVDGSRFPSTDYTVPIYAAPTDAVSKRQRTVFSSLDRTAIEDGALAGKNLEICYVRSPIDAFFAQIQGSTRVRLDSGKLLRLNYVASNGMPYTPVGKFLIERGIVSREEMSMDKIREFMEANPEEGRELRRKNRSFVFFKETPLTAQEECIGAQGVPLTPGRSLAVDKRYHIYGTPIWIDAEFPIESEKPETKFQRLLVAQDTGSAIVGPARADIYFGHGEEISHVAGRIKQYGQFVILVPQNTETNGNLVAAATNIPLPLPRPKMVVTAAARSNVITTGSIRAPKRAKQRH